MRRLLLVRLSAFGDVIHALPVAENAALAGAEVGWVVEAAFRGVLEGNPHCARLFTADTRAWRRAPFSAATRQAVRRLRAELRAFAPDLSLDIQGLFKSAFVARWAGAPVVGFAASARRESASALLCRVRVTPGPDARHVVDKNLALLGAAEVPVKVRRPDARYLLEGPSPDADAFVAALPRPYAVFHPGAGRADKAWSEERLARLAAALHERRGLTPVISWGPGDAARVDRIAALVPPARRAPLLDARGLARLGAGAALFVGGDTGPTHLADALGVPTLALFGPTDPERNGPYGDRRGIVRDMTRVTDAEALSLAESL
ncbi:MAG TPA: lipopolysaccharide heptosyltransferase I [Thermoanaerobaculia bacterium]|nr:lipopolysaccharide heptosyltransferase I [Thermoanaerobaculia bacterium]